MGRLCQIRLHAAAAAAALLAPASPALAADEFYFGDIGQAVATMAAFLLLLVVLRRFAWRPIISQLQLRERHIEQTIKSAQQNEQQASEMLRLYRARLDAVEAEAKDLLARSNKDAAELAERVLAAARQEAMETGQKLRQEIELDRQQTLEQLYTRTADLATEVAARVLGRTLSPQEHRRLIDQSLEDIMRQTQHGGVE